MYYYTDIYVDISCEGGGGVFIFRLIAWGGLRKILWTLGRDIKKRAAEKKNLLPPPRSIHNECSLKLAHLATWTPCLGLAPTPIILRICYTCMWKSFFFFFSKTAEKISLFKSIPMRVDGISGPQRFSLSEGGRVTSLRDAVGDEVMSC